ncbi:MAG: helix-turn-helix domain-containing protein [Thaumarchaeota archaeon]|nr:helix-turn-helix domain-containing protein [Nitrososphaerota archaeon]
MEIIRTGSTIPFSSHTGAHVDKGWVREGILSALSIEPATLTEVSRKLGVAKSTASYHLSQLVGRGVIEVVDSWVGRGGVQVKRYGLKEGSLVTLLSRGEEEAELGRLRETFDLKALAWESSMGAIGVEEVQSLLYRMFLHLFKIARSQHRALMREYGDRVGAILAKRLTRAPPIRALSGLVEYLSTGGISDLDMVRIPNSAVSVMVLNTCIGSTTHQTNSCYFLEGIIEGAAKSLLGPSIKVGRVYVPRLPSCVIAIGRVRTLDLGRLADTVLESPRYSGTRRGAPGA